MKGKTGKAEMGAGKVHEYNAVGSQAADEAKDETPEFHKGGRTKAKKHKDGGKAMGKAPKGRLDRKPRAAGGRNPFSSAENASGGAAEDEGGKREVNGPGAEIEIPTYKGGGRMKGC